MKTSVLLIIAAASFNDQAAFFRALADKESGGNPRAYNKAEDACGLYQIRRIYVDDCNRIAGRKAFSSADRWDKAKSEQMITIYLNHYATAKRLGHTPTWEDKAAIHCAGPRGAEKMKTSKQIQKYVADVIRRMKNEPTRIAGRLCNPER